ncbi:MAG TPA: hypothetical protein VLE74_03520 [Candidatus Saccharimonadales bacterium]|nr:hypothetical protein [Candidatus Saccharimonadales bacterium]
MGEVVVVLAILTAATAAFIYIAVKLHGQGGPRKGKSKDSIAQQAQEDVEHIFNDEFREELRNRGRLHFEKIIGDNAMFLQQDLRLTTSQLNEYMKTEITRKLQEEFAKYEESITDAKELAVESITKTQTLIEQQRQLMGQQLAHEIATEKARLMKRFEDNMADIINHYVLAAVGSQINMSDQLEFILGELDKNKQAILEDIGHDS